MGGCCNGATEQELKAYQKMMEEKMMNERNGKTGKITPIGIRP
jgi:hypothetical protein